MQESDTITFLTSEEPTNVPPKLRMKQKVAFGAAAYS
jgi:hypothetical protein